MDPKPSRDPDTPVPAPGTTHPVSVTENATGEQVATRPVARQCATCGGPIQLRDTGRPPTYCSNACRQKAWALRGAERALGTPADTRPAVVHEILERTTVRTVARTRTVYALYSTTPSPASAAPHAERGVPGRARDWIEQLAALTAQLRDPASPLARDHFDHRRLYTALEEAFAAVVDAHPGGRAGLLGRRPGGR
jgi:hypothetical protein